jgi:hypothetical protein
MAGDHSLIEIIQANAASDAPLQQIYRQALAQEPVVVDELSLINRRKELEARNLEIQSLNNLSSAAVGCTKNLKACGEECRQMGPFMEVVNAVSTLVDKAPKVKEALDMMVDMKQKDGAVSAENKQRMIGLEREEGSVLLKNKREMLELEQKDSDLKVLTKKRLLDLDREDFEMRRQAPKPSQPDQVGQAPALPRMGIQAPVPPLNQAPAPPLNQAPAPPLNQAPAPPLNQAPVPPLNQAPAPPQVESQVQPDRLPDQSSDESELWSSHEIESEEDEPDLNPHQPAQPDPLKVNPDPIITVYSVIVEMKMFVSVPKKEHRRLLAESEDLVAKTYRDAGHVELPIVREGRRKYAAYMEKDRRLIVLAVFDVVEAYLDTFGRFTMADMRNVIPKTVRKTNVPKILRAALALACTAILEKPGGRLMAKRGKVQTFDEGDEDILIHSINEAMKKPSKRS